MKNPMRRFLFAVVAATALTACGGGGLFSADIEYVVEGTAKSVFITVATADGGTAQATVNVPWRSPKNRFNDKAFVYISAQNQGSTGTVIAKILSDGKVIKETVSSGAYVIATASGTCC